MKHMVTISAITKEYKLDLYENTYSGSILRMFFKNNSLCIGKSWNDLSSLLSRTPNVLYCPQNWALA